MSKTKTILILALTVVSGSLAGCGASRKVDQDPAYSAFNYREIHLPDALDDNADKLGLNLLDKDWAIWGHNLSRVLPDSPSESVFAKINGVSNHSQFCFTSPRLFDYISDYIDDQYSPKDSLRFAILPNDNDVVCLCEVCIKEGNTPDNSSPAVYSLIRKLSARYPNHIFFGSDYRTTHSLPEGNLPENSGVIVSAIDYPLTLGSTPREETFLATLDEWNKKTGRILVWDYIDNFDDYFTPVPIFSVTQDRLKKYKEHNVTGIFLNGSGHDKSSLSRLKTLVLAELTRDPQTDWQKLLKQKAIELYPVTGEIIADFMIQQENLISENGAIIPLYEGVDIAKRRYLPEEEFIVFHDKLKSLKSGLKGEELKFIEELLGELALTRLELMRIKGYPQGAEEYLADLRQLDSNGVKVYNESGWSVESYINDYETLLNHYYHTARSNKLKGEKIIPITELDEDYSDVRILTDGVLGMPSNYHNGNLIITPKDSAVLKIPVGDGGRKLTVWLSYNPGYKIYLPQSLTLTGEGMEFQKVEPVYPKEYTGHYPVEFEIPEGMKGFVQLTLTKEPETRSIAIEEIELQ